MTFGRRQISYRGSVERERIENAARRVAPAECQCTTTARKRRDSHRSERWLEHNNAVRHAPPDNETILQRGIAHRSIHKHSAIIHHHGVRVVADPASRYVQIEVDVEAAVAHHIGHIGRLNKYAQRIVTVNADVSFRIRIRRIHTCRPAAWRVRPVPVMAKLVRDYLARIVLVQRENRPPRPVSDSRDSGSSTIVSQHTDVLLPGSLRNSQHIYLIENVAPGIVGVAPRKLKRRRIWYPDIGCNGEKRMHALSETDELTQSRIRHVAHIPFTSHDWNEPQIHRRYSFQIECARRSVRRILIVGVVGLLDLMGGIDAHDK